MNTEEVWRLIRRQAEAWELADVDAIVADFAPHGVFISPAGRWRGNKAIRSAAIAFFQSAYDVRIDIARVIVSGNMGAAEWEWSEVRFDTGRRCFVNDAIAFVIGEDGKIVYWREYFDTSQMESSDR